MNYYAMPGRSDERYTPKYIFDALDCVFDLDVAAPPEGPRGGIAHVPTHVPAEGWLWRDGLEETWEGFVWMNPPFGGRNGLVPWLDKFFAHGNGIALTPDRTSAPWWQDAARRANATLFIAGKVRFIRPDGTEGKSPGDGTTLFAVGRKGIAALDRAQRAGLGYMAQQFMEDLD